jgi:hypothetical protein
LYNYYFAALKFCWYAVFGRIPKSGPIFAFAVEFTLFLTSTTKLFESY